jgi:UDP-N-acetylenolpyruvoylglucosamine reductase
VRDLRLLFRGHGLHGRFLTVITQDAKRQLEAAIGEGIAEGVPLSEYTSFGIGGPAALFARLSGVDEIAAALAAAHALSIPTLVVGGGTNLLVGDAGFDGLALRVELGGIAIDAERRRVTVGAGVPVSTLVDALIADGLAGLEFAAGLPGALGGAIAGNAGCFGGAVGDRIVGATLILRDGTVLRIDDPSWFGFDYRASRVAAMGAVVADATVAVAPGDRVRLEETASAHLAVRHDKHPARGARTAGSYFKNLPPEKPGGQRRAAGALLESVGAKQMRAGGAAVFERHANIIVNEGGATARDVLALAERMRRAVEARFGVELEPEVRFVGERPEVA